MNKICFVFSLLLALVMGHNLCAQTQEDIFLTISDKEVQGNGKYGSRVL